MSSRFERMQLRLIIPVLCVAALVTACGSNSGADGAADAAGTTTTAPVSLTVLAFGDSMSYGVPAECANCVTWPHQVRDQLAATAGVEVTLIDATQHNKLTAAKLRKELETDNWAEPAGIPEVRTDLSPREAVAEADIITIAVGVNDLPWYQIPDACDTVYDQACADKIATAQGNGIEGALAEIDEIRAGRPTAIRLVNQFNDAIQGPDYDPHWFFPQWAITQALAGGRDIVDAMNRRLCATAAAHDAICVDIATVMNGPDGTKPLSAGHFQATAGDMNQLGHDEITAAIMAAGFAEVMPS